MTFEATDTRAPEQAVEERTAPVRRVRRTDHTQPLASRMLGFVSEASRAGSRLEGLALMFRSTFLPDHGVAPEDWEMAAEIVADCMDTIALSLKEIDLHAHEVHNHETRGGAR